MYLSRYGDFVNEIISNTGAWPDTAELEYQFEAVNSSTVTTWPATITGALATWNVDKADVATLLASGVTEYRLIYTENDYDLDWFRGQIEDVS
jgi:hypothetical protein